MTTTDVELKVATARVAAAFDVLVMLEDISIGVPLWSDDIERARTKYGIDIDPNTGRIQRWHGATIWKGGAVCIGSS